jgi:hypothetical protein
VPERAAIAIWLPNLVKIAPRFASLAPFWRLIVDHLECPDIYTYFSKFKVLLKAFLIYKTLFLWHNAIILKEMERLFKDVSFPPSR